MMNWIVKVLTRYGSTITVVLGVLLIILGVSLHYKKVETTESYNPRSAFSKEIKSARKTPTDTCIYLGAFLVLIGFKKKWIIKE